VRRHSKHYSWSKWMARMFLGAGLAIPDPKTGYPLLDGLGEKVLPRNRSERRMAARSTRLSADCARGRSRHNGRVTARA
jgi:hypothetical protein